VKKLLDALHDLLLAGVVGVALFWLFWKNRK